MSVMLGNLSIGEIEKRIGRELTFDEEKRIVELVKEQEAGKGALGEGQREADFLSDSLLRIGGVIGKGAGNVEINLGKDRNKLLARIADTLEGQQEQEIRLL